MVVGQEEQISKIDKNVDNIIAKKEDEGVSVGNDKLDTFLRIQSIPN